MRDQRGTELRVGQKVAYNYSGSIACGEITKVQDRGMRNEFYPNCTITIRQSAPDDGHISKVRNPSNVLVIFEDVAPTPETYEVD